ARKPETAIMEAIYRFHPMFAAEGVNVWFGGVEQDWGACTIEGGDVQTIGNGAVMIGMGERTSPQSVGILARNLFAAGGVAAEVGTVEEYAPAKAALAILCSSDDRYAEEAGRAARTLKAAGVRHLYLAGKPGDLERELKAEGVDEFVFAGMDVVAVLDRALTMTGD
ncbi:MAG: arginine deiminase family protein, partial [Caulobacter sp.]